MLRITAKFYGISYNPIFIAGWHQKSYIDPDSFEKHLFLRLGLIQILILFLPHHLNWNFLIALDMYNFTYIKAF